MKPISQTGKSEALDGLMIAVVGPTAGGKSELAEALAEAFGGEIISTDSLQVFRHLDIGTAKPAPSRRARIAHHLIDVAEPDESYSAGRYVADAQAALAGIRAAGRLPLLCGGTGLYYRALVQGLMEVPPVCASARAKVEAMVREEGVEACHRELERVDPATAGRLHPHDRARITRALEIYFSTGRPISEFQRRQPFRSVPSSLLAVGIQWERAALYARINRRVPEMLEQGWVEEVRRILAMGFSPGLKPLQSIGYREISALLRGEREEQGLVEDIARRTRNYAKRQVAWFRNQPEVHWFAPQRRDEIFRSAENFLKTGK